MLLVSDEVDLRVRPARRHTSAPSRFGYQPDIITCAKGMTSGYSPIGAMIASDRLVRAVPARATTTFAHGYTFGGHPVSAAVALANLDIFEREDLNEHVLAQRGRVPRAPWRSCIDLPIVGDVRGDGYFYGIELVKDKATKETFDDDESERLLRGFLSKALFDAGLYCRADDRGDPVVQLAPPLIVGQPEFDEIEQILRSRAHRGLGPALTKPPARHREPDRTPVRRLPEKAVTDRAVLDAVLDAGLVAHVAVVDARPAVRRPGRPTRATATACCSTARPAAGCSAPWPPARRPA